MKLWIIVVFAYIEYFCLIIFLTAAGHVDEIISDIARHGFTVVARRKFTLSAVQCEEFYAELVGLVNKKTNLLILPPLIDFMIRCAVAKCNISAIQIFVIGY